MKWVVSFSILRPFGDRAIWCRLDEYAALGEEPPEEEEVVSRDISPAERLELDVPSWRPYAAELPRTWC